MNANEQIQAAYAFQRDLCKIADRLRKAEVHPNTLHIIQQGVIDLGGALGDYCERVRQHLERVVADLERGSS